ncbi:hypothetical protein CKAN_01147500 [Cinnamomum micranthum f. kanehirae]|uniref:BRISC and BRCA1-A complex member 1 n=1 Tax=Cinnamomum micranthum f. kanehirae TaxID=337451 RepID=A0A443NW87_9MAGN|nr:hypothetical protein CKAN_01147500 [Cinnamomum micranthum f. kanehirae]
MSGYFLPSSSFAHEDILICVDVDPILDRKAEVPGCSTNMDCTRAALRFFDHAKLTINPGHRFAFCTLSQSSISWVGREFSSNVDSVLAALLDISADSSSHEHADVTQLFQIVACEATRCEKESRILRVILIYCRSRVRPEHHWPVDPNLFTLDVVFLCEESSVENRGQNVYNTLVEAVADISKYAGYVIQCFHGLVFALLSHMCVLLSHPQQRTAQDEIDIPKSLMMKSRKGKEVAFDCCW